MDIRESLAAAEKKYGKKLEQFSNLIFRGHHLPSHDPLHHRRVWNYAVELALSLGQPFPDERIPENLIIACFLHDAGMISDSGEHHGIISRELCVRFLNENSLPPEYFTGALEAIKNHDKKDYSQERDGPLLQILLNAADDLDAFGHTGIYRYIDIYLHRNVPGNEMGERILINASARFRNFMKYFGDIPLLINRHGGRFRILENFCRNYSGESPEYDFRTGSPSGYCGIASVIKGMIINKINPGEEALRYIEGTGVTDQVVRDFFIELAKELNERPSSGEI